MTKADEVKIKKEVVELQKEKRSQRVNAVLELKANMEHSFGLLQGENKKQNALREEEANEQNKVFQELLGQGQNPYEIFRRKTMEKRAQRKVQRQQDKIKQTEMEIADRILKEDERTRSKELKEKEKKAYADKYQHELGRKAKEDRVRDYMIAKTTGHTELVDPTGRIFRIDPSQVTTIKDNTFGLGKSTVKDVQQRDEVIAMIKSKKVHKHVEADPRFIPKLNDERVEQSSKQYEIRERTVLEEQIFQSALERQKNNIFEKQIVWGKEFKGRAFLSNPESIVFKDFDVDKPMKMKFQLTNISNTFNHFKLLSLPDRTKDFFEIVYKKPGRMSAGMSCNLEITFNPKVNSDIYDEIPFLAKTGPFSVPLICTTKKALPEVNVKEISLENVVLGEVSRTSITIENRGALAFDFEVIELLEDRNDTTQTARKLSTITGTQDMNEGESSLLDRANAYYEMKRDMDVDSVEFTTHGTVPDYGQAAIHFTYSPLHCQELERNYEIKFLSPATCESIRFKFRATSVEVPIYVEKKLLDFRCCVFGKLYRSKLVVRNRGKVALKCQIQVPSEFKECIEFLPNFGYVQGCGTEPGRFEIQMKFRPTSSLIEQLQSKSFVIPGETNLSSIIAVPILVMVPEQTLPVYCILRSELCSSDILFSSNRIDFGTCFINQSVSQEIVLHNQCKLPQKYGFVKLGPHIDIKPNDGFGILLPEEKRTIEVIFRPISAIEYNFNLICRTTLNQQFLLPCKGQGALPSVYLSENVIEFGAIPIGENMTYNIIVKNESNVAQPIEFIIPSAASKELFIRPQVIPDLPAHSSALVEIEFSPQATTATAATTTDPDEVENTEQTIESGEINEVSPEASEGLQNEPKLEEPEDNDPATSSVVHSITTKRDGITIGSTVYPDIEAEPISTHKLWKIPCLVQEELLCLQVHTTTIESDLTCNVKQLDFGQIAVGQSKILKLQLTNNGAVELPIQMESIVAVGPFSVLNALRSVSPYGGIKNIYIKFLPLFQNVCQDIMTIKSTRGNVNIKLRGEGVSPSLTVEPDDGQLNFQHVLAGHKKTMTFTLHNSSVFSLNYCIDAENHCVSRNYNNLEVFSCIPSEGTIPPGESQVITTFFQPDHEQQHEFSCVLHIKVPNQKEDHLMHLKGRCWNTQAYICAPDTTITRESAFSQIDTLFSLPNQSNLPSTRNRQIHLIFAKTETEKTLTLGNMEVRDNGSNATFEFNDDPSNSTNYFTVEPSKGSLSQGQQQPITIRYNPPHQEDTTDNKLNVGQWIEHKWHCIIKGGFKSPPNGQQVEVKVKGYLQVT